jgi:bacterial microcompartment shell protein
MPRSISPESAVLGPALAMLQITDVPAGLRALDALVKEAPVEIVAAGTVQCGHYLIAFAGDVEAVSRSYARAIAFAGGTVYDRVLLPDAEPRIVPGFRDAVVRAPSFEGGDALGVVQSAACPVLLGAIDAALKGARVDLVELRVAEGLGGKALATVWGEQADVEAAIEIACGVITRAVDAGAVLLGAATTSIIPRADEELLRAVSSGTRFFREWRG